MKTGKQSLMFVVLSVAVMFMLACTCGGLSIPPDLSGGKATSAPSTGKTTPVPSTGKGTPAPAATKPSAALPGDAKGAVVQAATNLKNLKSYRMKMVTEQDGKATTMVMEAVPPNKIHMTGDAVEMIVIGDDIYTKMGNTWNKTTNPGTAAQYAKSYATQDTIVSARKEGSEAVSGVACDKYVYTAKVGDNPPMDITVWIGVKDGLPYKIVTKPNATTTTTQTLYDVNADIKIEPPVAGQASPQPPAASGGGELRQWATAARASSEYGSGSDWTAKSATGAPDVTTCSDDVNAWASQEDNTVEWIELTYATPINATLVRVLQTYNPTQIVKIELIEPNGTAHVVHNEKPKQVTCPQTLSISFQKTAYKVNRVKITIDQSVLGLGWNEIDAVELVGVK
jgi:hypothetical protein